MLYFDNKINKNGSHGIQKENHSSIGVVGGGPAAVSLVMQLVKKIKASGDGSGKIDIHVFEKKGVIGSGLPYVYPDNAYILNLPTDVMEPMGGQNGQFTKWCEAKYGPLDTKFPPRYYFGEYLADSWKKLLVEAKEAGINIHVHTNTEVTNIKKNENDNFFIEANNNVLASCDSVVLCTGHNMEPDSYRELIGSPNYQHVPWNDIHYEGIQHITLIGARLTAIDQALRLVAKGYKGNIAMVSKSGLLPAVLSKDVPPYELKYLTMSNLQALKGNDDYLPLDKLMALFWKEISHAMGENVTFHDIIQSCQDMSPSDWLDKEIKHAEKGDKYWQHVLFALYPSMPDIWSMLSSEDKIEFMDKYYSLMIGYLAAFPLENAYRLKSVLDSNQLSVYGGIQSIKYQDEHYVINLEGQPPIKSEYVINATGSGYGLNSPLYQNLLDDKQIIGTPLGGIDVCFETSQISTPYGINKGFYLIGPMTFWTRLLVADMYVTSNQAGSVAGHIVKNRLYKNKPNSYPSSPNSHNQINNNYRFFPMRANGNNSFNRKSSLSYISCRNRASKHVSGYGGYFFKSATPGHTIGRKAATILTSGLKKLAP